MEISGIVSLLAPVIGGAGLAAALASLTQFTESTRARKAIESAAEALQNVGDDKAPNEALRLAMKVASIQLSAVSLVRVPLHRLLMPFAKLLLISLGVVFVVTVLLGAATVVFLSDLTIPPGLAWVAWPAISFGFFLAYRGALSQSRDEFVSQVLAEDGTNLDMVRQYNKSLKFNPEANGHQASPEAVAVDDRAS